MVWFSWVWAVPLVLLSVLFWPTFARSVVRWVGLALLPAVGVWLGLAFGWIPMTAWVNWPDFVLGVQVGMDPIRFYWLGLTLVVWGLSALHHHWIEEQHATRYSVFFLLSLSGSLGMVLAGDAVSFYLAFGLMSLAAWGLVVHDETPNAWQAGRWYLGLALIGELVLFAGIVMRSAELGTTDLAVWQSAMSSGWSLALIGLGLGIKLGLPGLHIWLPLAHPAAPIPASALLSGIMIKAGLFGWVFLLPIASVPNEQWVSLLAWVGVIMMLYGVILGLMQTDPKTILAYSSMSQMGWGVWAFSLVWQAEGSHATLLLLVWFMVHHGLVKTGLFLGVGWIKYSAEKVFIRPWVWSGLILLALMLAGLPWTAGAWVKLELKDLADSEMLAVPGLTLASIGTGLLMIHFLRKLVYLPIKPKVLSDSARRQANWALGSWFGLIVLALVWPYGLVESLVMDWRAAIQPIGLALVFALAWRIRIHRQYQLPAGDLLWVYRWIGLRLWSFIQLVGLGLQKSELRWRLVRHRMLRGIRRAGRMVMKSEQVFLRFGVMVMGLVWIALVLSLLAWLEQLANSG